MTTTMGYYTISLKRKQQAITAVGSLATDKTGKPAPFTSPTAYQRASVSVPYGNCTEPSNVTAGGGACPIRFQCAGCGFFRVRSPCCPRWCCGVRGVCGGRVAVVLGQKTARSVHDLWLCRFVAHHSAAPK